MGVPRWTAFLAGVAVTAVVVGVASRHDAPQLTRLAADGSPSTTAPSTADTTTTAEPVSTTTSSTTTSTPPRTEPVVSLTLSCAPRGASVSCTWSAIPAGMWQEALLREPAGASSTVVFNTDDLSITSFVDRTVTAGATYTYRIVSASHDRHYATSLPAHVTVAGTPSPTTSTTSTTAAPTTTTTTAPDGVERPPTLQASTRVTCGAATVSTGDRVVSCAWTDPGISVASWEVIRRTSGAADVLIAVRPGKHSIGDTGLTQGAAYRYIVHGLDADGHVIVLGYTTVSCCPPR